ncbi:SusC/RagA family TonB-linked outer membrane protein [uncultured Pontibacter sp.]|uniref:SusC/RagA family TonB-linked outer membrane protein n=1 Tax=uncultured Pontibacter sp. TaxID=453356 RepID=UPI00262D570D|nr:SusC/RagA family TonB-linked outer membrane protein [uncultured Pontibacter sp.]
MIKQIRYCLLWVVCFLLVHFQSAAQGTTVSGTVTATSDNSALPGVSVVVKGTSRGTATDPNGAYQIQASPEDVLVFRFIGMKPVERTVGDATTIDVALEDDAQSLGEVVVTALGIERDRRTLTYSIQNIQGEDLRSSNQANIVNSLQGQIAGAQISSSGGSPGLPSEIVLRGVSSLTGDNQPLIIVDGIRVSNASTNGTVNRLADFNPEDVDNITVLKGAAASALYGIDAASGAIIITTKKGKAGKMAINASVRSFVETVGRLPEQQKLYTSGFGGIYDPSTTSNWGRKFRSDELIYDNPSRFFQTGVVNDVNFNVNGGTENYNYYVSGNYRGGTATIPNTESERLSLLIKGSAKLSKKLELTTSANYIDNTIQEGLIGSGSGGWANSIYRYPLRYDIRNYQYPNGAPNYEYYYDNQTPDVAIDDVAIISPMWNVMRNPRNTQTRRIVLNGLLNYNPTEWLNVSYRLGQDYYNQDYGYVYIPGTPGSWEGRLYESKGNFVNTTSILNTTISKSFLNDFHATVILGTSQEYYEAQTNAISGERFQNPDIHSVNVIEPINIVTSEGNPRRRRYAAYGDFKLEYKNLVSLNYTGRNDWSSTLPRDNRSFYYSSYGASFAFSELLPSQSWYGKLRASYAQVGKDAPIYSTDANLIKYPGIGGGFVKDATAGNPNLKPETTTEKELGAEFRFFDSRLSIDATLYDAMSEDQIIRARVPLTTGYVIQTFNAGSIRNKGFEISIGGTPVQVGDFSWNVTLNTWKNKSRMLELPDQVRVFPYTFGQPYSSAIAASALDQPVLGIVGTDYLRNEDGYMVIGENGYPVINSADRQQYIGNREPKLNFGFLNRMNYKSLSLSFLWDFRFGGDVYNATRLGMISNGISEDVGQWRDREFVFNGVVDNGDGSYSKNTKTVVLDYNYFATNYTAVGTNFVERVNWARLRHVTLNYTLPSHLTSLAKVGKVGLELSAQNPLLFTNYSGGDPEVNSAGPNAGGAEGGSTMGVDFGAIPLAKSYSFGITVGF